MSRELVSLDEVYNMLSKSIFDAESQKAYARRVGISPQYLSDIIKRKRNVPDCILKDLGIERVTEFYVVW